MTRILLTAFASLALLAAPAAAQEASLTDIEDEVMCPICGTTLELSASPQALAVKVAGETVASARAPLLRSPESSARRSVRLQCSPRAASSASSVPARPVLSHCPSRRCTVRSG